MRLIFGVFLVILLLFSGCGSTGGGIFGGSSSDPEEDRTGNGLEVDLSVDTKWLKQDRKLKYEVVVENTGKKEIKLSESNFVIDSKTPSSGIFKEGGLGEFYTILFNSGSEVILYQNQKTSAVGFLELTDEFVDTNFDEASLSLTVNFPYETEFSNNVLIKNNNQGDDILRTVESLEQAAPIKVTDVGIEKVGSNHRIIFRIENNYMYPTEHNNNGVTIKTAKFWFRQSSSALTSCGNYRDISESGDKYYDKIDKMIFTKDDTVLYYICSISLDDFNLNDVITTQVGGKLEYDFNLYLEESFSVPNIEKKFTDQTEN